MFPCVHGLSTPTRPAVRDACPFRTDRSSDLRIDRSHRHRPVSLPGGHAGDPRPSCASHACPSRTDSPPGPPGRPSHRHRRMSPSRGHPGVHSPCTHGSIRTHPALAKWDETPVVARASVSAQAGQRCSPPWSGRDSLFHPGFFDGQPPSEAAAPTWSSPIKTMRGKNDTRPGHVGECRSQGDIATDALATTGVSSYFADAGRVRMLPCVQGLYLPTPSRTVSLLAGHPLSPEDPAPQNEAARPSNPGRANVHTVMALQPALTAAYGRGPAGMDDAMRRKSSSSALRSARTSRAAAVLTHCTVWPFQLTSRPEQSG
jgi:hypothetical protein